MTCEYLLLTETGFDAKDLVKENIHDTGRGVLLARVVLRDTYKLKLRKELIVEVKDTYTVQLVHCGAKPELTIGSCKPSSKMPEGTVIPSVEERPTIFLPFSFKTIAAENIEHLCANKQW